MQRVRGRRQYAVKGDVTGEKERFVGAVTSEISSVRTGAFKINPFPPLHWRAGRGGTAGHRRRPGAENRRWDMEERTNACGGGCRRRRRGSPVLVVLVLAVVVLVSAADWDCRCRMLGA